MSVSADEGSSYYRLIAKDSTETAYGIHLFINVVDDIITMDSLDTLEIDLANYVTLEDISSLTYTIESIDSETFNMSDSRIENGKLYLTTNYISDFTSKHVGIIVENAVDSQYIEFYIGVNPAPNTAPLISSEFSDINIDQGSSNSIAFSVEDSSNELGMVVSSDNVTLIPVNHMSIYSSELHGNYSLVIIPEADRYGEATITITVTDSGGLSSTQSFFVTVNPVITAALNNKYNLDLKPYFLPEITNYSSITYLIESDASYFTVRPIIAKDLTTSFEGFKVGRTELSITLTDSADVDNPISKTVTFIVNLSQHSIT